MNTVVNTSETIARIKAILKDKLGVEESALVNNASFANDLALDSLDVLEAFMAFEKEFGIKISDEDAEKLTTVGSVIDYIVARRN
jgi:acyl carrier protein